MDITNCSMINEARTEIIPMFHAAPLVTLSAILEDGLSPVYGSNAISYVFTRGLDTANRIYRNAKEGGAGKWRVML